MRECLSLIGQYGQEKVDADRRLGEEAKAEMLCINRSYIPQVIGWSVRKAIPFVSVQGEYHVET